MILDAMREGKLKKGDYIIEPSSGNTGIGLAMVSSVLGLKAVITLPERFSQEKEDILKGLGAEVIRTPGVPSDHLNSHIGTAVTLNNLLPNSMFLD